VESTRGVALTRPGGQMMFDSVKLVFRSKVAFD
jgi:hypothetical protein